MVDDRSDATTGEGAVDGNDASAGGCPTTAVGRVVVPVEGELDAQNGEQLRRALADAFDAAPTSVAVDLRRLDFIDSVGLSVLVEAHNRGAAEDIPFQVMNASSACLRVLEITRLVDVLDVR